MSGSSEMPQSEIESSRSSLIFIQLLLLALPIMTAPVIFTSSNIGEDFGIDLLILTVIGAEFVVLAIFGMRKSKDFGENTDYGNSKSVEEIQLQCPNCQGVFPIFVNLPYDENEISKDCTFCGEEYSVFLIQGSI